MILKIDNAIVCQRNIKGKDLYIELNDFIKKDLKLFQKAVENEICSKFGIILPNNSKKALETAFRGKNIAIVDLHDRTTEKIVYKTQGATIICYDNLLECANEVLTYGR